MAETIGEEIFNSITHGVGALAALSGLIILLILAITAGNIPLIIASSIYGVSLFLLFLTSTLYHSIQAVKAKKIFRILDHSAIYGLIAGTYTPISLIVFKNEISTGGVLLGLIWTLAIIGIILKIFFIDHLEKIALVLYLGMGWIAVLFFRSIFPSLKIYETLLLITGGLLYTTGVWFYQKSTLKFHHAYWHLCVLGGSIAHYIAVLTIIKSLT